MSRAVTTVVPGIFLRRPGLPIFGWIQAPLRPTACADAVTTTATAFVLRRRLDCCGALDARSIAIDTTTGRGVRHLTDFTLNFDFGIYFDVVFISFSFSFRLRCRHRFRFGCRFRFSWRKSFSISIPVSFSIVAAWTAPAGRLPVLLLVLLQSASYYPCTC